MGAADRLLYGVVIRQGAESASDSVPGGDRQQRVEIQPEAFRKIMVLVFRTEPAVADSDRMPSEESGGNSEVVHRRQWPVD